MRRGRGSTPLVAAIAAAGLVAGCGEVASSPDKVETQLERQMPSNPRFVECDRSDDRPNERYTCRVETSSAHLRYVATCPSPGGPCVLRRTADQPN